MSVKLLTEHHLEFLSLKGGCTDSSESTFVKMPHCWKSHVTAHLLLHLFSSLLFSPFSNFVSHFDLFGENNILTSDPYIFFCNTVALTFACHLFSLRHEISYNVTF